MLTNELLDNLVTIYAALLSTALAINEIRKSQKKIKIILDYWVFETQARLVIVNNSQRPISIKNISIRFGKSRGGDQVPKNAMFLEEIEFPVNISPYDFLSIPLSDSLSNATYDSNGDIMISVFDSEAKEYNKFSTQITNSKWGYVKNKKL